MFYRFALSSAVILLLTVPAAGVNLYPVPDETLLISTQRLKEKDYRGARDTALRAANGGMRNLVAGIASLKMEQWDEAASLLGKAAVEFPLLADYALFNRAQALSRGGRHEEALESLRQFFKDHSNSTLSRQAEILRADCLFATRDFRSALAAYQSFIERHASGPDAQNAQLQLASCQEELGDRPSAAMRYRNFWLANPGSRLADRAEEGLRRLAAAGSPAPAFTSDELVKRASTLYDLKKFEQALRALESIPAESLTQENTARLKFKIGQTLMKLRRFRDAEKVFAELSGKELKRDIACETLYWQAKALDRCGRENEAYDAFISLSQKFPEANLADDAMLEAALIRKFQRKPEETLESLNRLLKSYPATSLKQRTLWEMAWMRYSLGEFKLAAEEFKRLLSFDEMRDRALYWHGRALSASGDKAAAQSNFDSLLEDYPYSYYSLIYRSESGIKEKAEILPYRNVSEILPVPQGLERVKALIVLGLTDDAKREMAVLKKKNGAKSRDTYGLARLYLEIDDFNSASTLVKTDKYKAVTRENLAVWGLVYPMAYRDLVMDRAAQYDVPPDLVYGVMRAESNFLPTAHSHAGAMGLMQLMPSTAKSMKRKGDPAFDTASLNQPGTNINLGVRHLRDLLLQYRGNQILAIAAYNAGANNVDRWRKSFGKLRKDEFIENIPFGETREYVKKVLSNAAMYRRLYGTSGKEPIQTRFELPIEPPSTEEPVQDQAPLPAEPAGKSSPIVS